MTVSKRLEGKGELLTPSKHKERVRGQPGCDSRGKIIRLQIDKAFQLTLSGISGGSRYCTWTSLGFGEVSEMIHCIQRDFKESFVWFGKLSGVQWRYMWIQGFWRVSRHRHRFRGGVSGNFSRLQRASRGFKKVIWSFESALDKFKRFERVQEGV